MIIVGYPTRLSSSTKLAMPEEWITVGLLRAAKNGNFKNAGLALSKGANVNITDEAGSTPLMLAAGLGHLETVQVLIGGGGDVNATDLPVGHPCCARRAMVMSRLWSFCWPPASGNSALHRVAEDGEENVVQALLEAGVNAGAKNKAGETAHDLALAAAHKNVAKVLEEH